MTKVAVAMSGGIDSSVTAALLKEQGYDVIGITMEVLPQGNLPASTYDDAKKVADILDIPHHSIDLSDAFKKKVISHFCKEYSIGRTPNPCIKCNMHIKFGDLMNYILDMGVDYMATGHYARVTKHKERYVLSKGVDETKDQSYFLSQLTQRQLEKALLPLGEFTKIEVRQKASELGLPVAEKNESQEICFIPDNDYRAFLADTTNEHAAHGDIIDQNGTVIGKHNGIMHYTIGQRHGLGIATGQPLYVNAINPETNTITVGTKDDIYSDELIATDLNWISIDKPVSNIMVKAKIRYQHRESPAHVTPLNNGEAIVKFIEPQMAITPGQSVVFYQGNIIAGAGIIK